MASKQEWDDHLKKGSTVSGYEAAVSGAISGGVARGVTAPLDTLKIRLQLQTQNFRQSPSVFRVAKDLFLNEGPFAFWKGNVPAEILYVLYGAIQFASYSYLNRTIGQLSNDYNVQFSTTIHSLVTGMGSGIVSTTASYPFDLLRTRLAANSTKRFLSMTGAVKDIMKNEGIIGIFSGIKPAMLSISLNTGFMFATYEKAREYSRLFPHIPFIEGICGFIAGAAAKGLTFPLDTIRKRCQMYAVNNNNQIASAMELGKTILLKEGPLGFYRGFAVSVLKTAPTSAISMWMYEYSLNFIRSTGYFQ
jgi:solute carrier family 25 thiamine pyrophosphate transporter 19